MNMKPILRMIDFIDFLCDYSSYFYELRKTKGESHSILNVGNFPYFNDCLLERGCALSILIEFEHDSSSVVFQLFRKS